jgi:hypothetical protein
LKKLELEDIDAVNVFYTTDHKNCLSASKIGSIVASSIINQSSGCSSIKAKKAICFEEQSGTEYNNNGVAVANQVYKSSFSKT